MNIIERQKQCAFCGAGGIVENYSRPVFTFPRWACSRQCIRSGATNFFDATTTSDQPVLHVHVTCDKCGFQWLEQPNSESDVRSAW